MRAKNDRGEKAMDLLRNDAILALLLSAAQELGKQEEEEVRTGFRARRWICFIARSLTGCA